MTPSVSIGRASVYEVLVVLATAAAGIATLFAPGVQSEILAGALTGWGLLLYDIGITAGAAAVVTGWAVTESALRAGHHIADGLKLERAGLIACAPLVAAYAVAVLLSGPHGLLNGSVCVALAAAHTLRIARITRDLSALRIVIATATDEPTGGDR